MKVIVYFQEFVSTLNLKPMQLVLDVGCGIGGSAFHMAQVNVHCKIQLSSTKSTWCDT